VRKKTSHAFSQIIAKSFNILFQPSNIRVSGDKLKLLGFGLSRLQVEGEEVTHNYGSVGYAAPEQVNNDVITETADAWAIGVLVYILWVFICVAYIHKTQLQQ